MKRFNTEVIVGFFLLVGLLSFAFLAVKLGGLQTYNKGHYELTARFINTSGLKNDASVELAGVEVGRVKSIVFDPETYESVVTLSLPDEVKLQEDTIASVRSTGLIGGKFLKLTPGGADIILKDGDTIYETESSVSLEELISKYIFETEKS
ncbi:MAG: outer membrane lipid asymmetry maintenance protein MlaD [gamma proteobacterium symbiont of Bathyaustriella thionipta]|nr:outer membrane lipid asymmetry maintenance protein MlaD [gamma proteobacterium symbiont of Bathyaustriella thionipta]